MNDFYLILASSSPRRKELLNNYHIPYKSFPANIDESKLDHETHLEYVLRMSLDKANKVYHSLPEKLNYTAILAADTIVYKDDQIFHKTDSIKEAYQNLSDLSGSNHQVATSFILLSSAKKIIAHETSISTVTFKELNHQQLQNYLETKEYLGKAGSYAIQGKGADLIEKYQGDKENIIGLPMTILLPYLKLIGF